MLIEPYQTLLTGAVAAAVIGIIGALLGAWIQGRREHTRWVRRQRMTAYLDFMRVTERMTVTQEEPRLAEDYVDELKNALAALRLVGPNTVHEAGYNQIVAATLAASERSRTDATGEQKEWAAEQLKEARLAVVKAARKALAIKD